MEPEPKCKCGKPGTEELHPCPYAEEINDCHEAACNCCAECEHQCGMDV